EEFAGTYGPSSRSTDEGDLGIAGHGYPGQFRGRVGMGKAAADGAPLADLIMRDVGECLAQQRVRGGQPPIVLDVAPANPGAKPNAALADGNVAEPGNPAQIDQHARRRQSEGENRNQSYARRRSRLPRDPTRAGRSLPGVWLGPGTRRELVSSPCLAKRAERAVRQSAKSGLG